MCIICEYAGIKVEQRAYSNYGGVEVVLPISSHRGDITLCIDHAIEISAVLESLLKIEGVGALRKIAISKELHDVLITNGSLKYMSICSEVYTKISDKLSIENPDDPEKYIKSIFADIVKEVLESRNDSDSNTIGKDKNNDINLHSPKWVKSYLDKYVVGQEEAKKALSIAVVDHYRRLNNTDLNLKKSNILITGPSGCGKTLLAEIIASLLDVPFVAVDASSLTAEGYVGKSPNSILLTLFDKAGGDIKKAEKGIIYLDEIDKIAASKGNGKDVGGSCVQEQLLRMLQGDEVSIEKELGPGMKVSYTINTKNILFICSGAFEGLDKIMNKELDKKQVGFKSSVDSKEVKRRVVPTTKDLMDYGFDRQFLGRFSIITGVEKLSVEQLKDIIVKPKDSILNEFKSLFATEGASLRITNPALDEISKAAAKEEIGARGIRRLMESLLQPYKYNIDTYKDGDIIKIGKQEVVNFLAKNQVY